MMGPMGPAGVPGLRWRGPFDCQNGLYAPNDVVEYNGSSWVTTQGIGGCVDPPNAPWQLLAEKGDASALADDALKLGGVAAAQYLRKDIPQTVAATLTVNSGASTIVVGGGANSGGIFATNSQGNFHIDADKTKGDGRIYLNYFNGKGIAIGNGANTVVASIDTLGKINAAGFNGVNFYTQNCTRSGPFISMSCDAVCKDPTFASCSAPSARGTCVSAKMSFYIGTPVPESHVACADGITTGAAGGTISVKCYCSTF